MYINRKQQGPVCGQIIKDRRSGLDRRVITYDGYLPERRVNVDRRADAIASDEKHDTWPHRRRYA